MARVKSYFYLLDNLNRDSAEKIKKALKVLEPVSDVRIIESQGLLEVISKKNIDVQIKMACDMYKVNLRTKVKKNQIKSL